VTDVEHRAADPDELAEANQEGYNEGRACGHKDGMMTAAVIVRERAAALFLAEREVEAKALREIALSIAEIAAEDRQVQDDG